MCVTAVADGTYPLVFNNNRADGSFGITSKIFLDQLTPGGFLLDTLEVPDSPEDSRHREGDHLVTSFSSKSELALNLSTSRRYLTFMGYVAVIDQLDASNSNTPLPFTVDPTNPVGESFLRAVAQVDEHGRFQFTATNAYSGNNGRAAILNDTRGARVYYTAGNAGNGGDPQPDGIIVGAGAQIIDPSDQPEEDQNPGIPTPVASFWVSELGADPVKLKDKVGKDDNFRGMTIHNQVLYYTKGSGGNGINTVYFVDTTSPLAFGLPTTRRFTSPTRVMALLARHPRSSMALRRLRNSRAWRNGCSTRARIRIGSSRSRTSWPLPRYRRERASRRFAPPSSGKCCAVCRSRRVVAPTKTGTTIAIAESTLGGPSGVPPLS